MMKKILFMIMCHKNAKQVLRLAKTLNLAEADIVIHADMNLNEDEMKCLCVQVATSDNIYITDDRIHGVLDTRSLVDIVFIMLNYMRDKGNEYKYYCLLSGQDYPVQPISYIESELDRSYPKPFIDCTPCDKSNWVYQKFITPPWIIQYNNFISMKFSRKNPICKGLRLTAMLMHKMTQVFKCNAYSSLSKKNVELYGGSAWWILPDVAINYIVDEYNNSAPLIKELLNTRTPEETFFQIMTMHSPIKEYVQVNPINQINQNCKTWAYFSDIDKPFKGHPYIFTVNELGKLVHSNFWFARKFDVDVDSEILDLLDKHIATHV